MSGKINVSILFFFKNINLKFKYAISNLQITVFFFIFSDTFSFIISVTHLNKCLLYSYLRYFMLWQTSPLFLHNLKQRMQFFLREINIVSQKNYQLSWKELNSDCIGHTVVWDTWVYNALWCYTSVITGGQQAVFLSTLIEFTLLNDMKIQFIVLKVHEYCN